MIDGVGYSAYVALNDSAMNIGHNSSLRDLTLQTNETTRMSIDGSGVTTIQNSGNALLKVSTTSGNGDSVASITFKNDNFIWMSMYQIKQCLQQDAWVANSIRSIISHL